MMQRALRVNQKIAQKMLRETRPTAKRGQCTDEQKAARMSCHEAMADVGRQGGKEQERSTTGLKQAIAGLKKAFKES